MKGTLVKLADGTLAIRCESQSMIEPVTTVHTWKANNARLAHGSMRYATLDEAIGKPAESGNGGQWSVYAGTGTYYTVWTGADAPAISVETVPVPKPKVRSGVETRWHHNGYRGLWQKYSKSERAWVPA